MQFPEILSVDKLCSGEMVHSWGDPCSTFPCVNDLGAFRIMLDPMAVCDILMPPFSNYGESTGLLYVNQKHAPSEGIAVTYQWFPDRVERRCRVDGLAIKTVVRAAVGRPAVLISLGVTNPASESRAVEIGIKVCGRMIHTVDGWASAAPQVSHLSDHPETWQYDSGLGAMAFSSQPKAFSVQGSRPRPHRVEGKSLLYDINLPGGATWNLKFVVALGDSEQQAAENFLELAEEFDEAWSEVRKDWTRKIQAAFTPGNTQFSGHLPILRTSDKELERLYYMSFLSTLFCRRRNPLSQMPAAYVTLMPDTWGTAMFLWDTFLADSCLAMLDPEVLRDQVERWITMDLHSHLSVDYITGKSLGPWYAVNHTALVHMAFASVRYTGDMGWLDKPVAGKPIIDHLEAQARFWRELDTNGHGLADCGNGWNCGDGLTTWIHETAGFNAQWVGALRQLAQLREARGEKYRADALRNEAAELLRNTLDLYVDGQGYWCARQPDGRDYPVRTVYDLYAVLENIPNDLTPSMRDEMVEFFETELKTRTWVRGLSPLDDDAPRSARPDWGWNGAYGAFPPIVATGLYKIGRTDGVVEWMRKVAPVTNQGLIGQCHLVENVAEPFQGGSRKALIGGWTMISIGAFIGMFVEAFFGVDATLSGGLQWRDQWGSMDSDATLENVPYQGKNYRVTRQGIEEM